MSFQGVVSLEVKDGVEMTLFVFLMQDLEICVILVELNMVRHVI